MAFAYYKRLRPAQKRIYRQSDRITAIELPEAEGVLETVTNLECALSTEDRRATELAAQELSDKILRQLRVPRIKIRVLAARPSKSYGELHGLYESDDPLEGGKVTLWMRTAQKKQVVAFRTFLRTFLHELCHHLDYTLLKLGDSFHTEGFFQRESSLLRQIVPPVPVQASLF